MKTTTPTKTLTLFFALMLIAGPLFLTTSHQAYAKAAPVIVVGDVINAPILTGILAETTAILAETTAILTVETASLTKETFLDAIAFLIAKTIIQQLTNDIVNWINSGFDGNPAFVTNLGGFFKDVADQAAGSFIEGTELGFLCDPFELDIRYALSLQNVNRFDVSCRLGDVVDNIDGFLNGDFVSGGWGGWYQLSVNDNPYKNFLKAESELQFRTSNAKLNEKLKLDFGNGFLSWEECTGEDSTGAKTGCEVQTPGKVIESQLEHQLGTGLRQLELADEFNEIIGALVGQLVQQILTGGGGLRGTSRSSYGQTSYAQQLGSGSSITNPVVNASKAEIDQSIKTERDYRTTLISGLASMTSLKSLNEQLRSIDANKAAAFDTTIASREVFISSELATVNKNITDLQVVETELRNASLNFEVTIAVQRYSSLQSSGRLHAEANILETRHGLETLGLDIQNAIDSA